MSGIEVAGLVLGAIPLVISAMEHYADGVETLGRYRRYKLELRTLINILQTEKTKLMNTCDKLLVGLAPPWQIEAMIENPYGELWREKEMQKKIRVRLWRSFTVFEDTVKDVHAAIEEMVLRLGLQPDGKVKWVEGNAIVRELRKATFSLKKSSYDDLLARIKDGIASLETLTTQNVELEPQRRMRSQGRLLSLLREISKSIFRALKGSLSCRDAHDLNLELAARSADCVPEDDDEKITKEFSFRIAISGHPSLGSEHQSVQKMQFWDEVILKETTLSSRSPSPEPARPSPYPTPVKKGKGKTVSFWSQLTFESSASNSAAFISSTSESTIGTNNTYKSTIVTTSRSKSPSAASSTSTFTVLQSQANSATLIPAMAGLTIGTTNGMANFGTLPMDLCETLRRARKQEERRCYGHIIDSLPMAKTREYGVYPIECPSNSDKWSTISLRDVLESSGKEFPPLTYQDRLQLAVVISSSVLQLHRTPWLPDRLRSDDVLFIRRENVPLYRHAFMAKRIPEIDSATAAAGAAIWPSKAAQISHNPTLTSLGVLLIELILGKPLHAGRGPRGDEGEGDLLADYVAAQRLLGEVDTMGGSNYGSAVRRCLNCQFFRHSLSLEDDGLRQDVYNGVVALLEEDLKNARS